MNRPVALVKEWIRKYPVAGFFVSGIVICFATLFPAIYLLPHNAGIGGIIGFYASRISVYSPVLAGILVTRLILPGKHSAPFFRRLRVSFPVWILAMIVSITNLRLTAPSSVPTTGLIVLSLPVALLPAWVVSSAAFGSEGLRDMLRTLIKPRGKLVYYAIALLTFPIITLAGSIITAMYSGRVWSVDIGKLSDLVPAIVTTFFFVALYAGGVNEESGWRGFAQRRLQSKFSPLTTSVILWGLMVVWHIPNDLLQYQHGGYVMIRLVLYFFITILFSWIYNRTEGSILPLVFFHASMNAMNPLMGLLPITVGGNVLLIGIAITVVIADRMWRRLPGDHPAVYSDNSAFRSAA